MNPTANYVPAPSGWWLHIKGEEPDGSACTMRLAIVAWRMIDQDYLHAEPITLELLKETEYRETVIESPTGSFYEPGIGYFDSLDDWLNGALSVKGTQLRNGSQGNVTFATANGGASA